MILYLDTSSLLKLYVNESGSDEVRQDLSAAANASTSLVSYAEARAAFARGRRLGSIGSAELRLAKKDFDADWSKYLVIEPTIELCMAAGDLAERYQLRGFDSIHLATFLHLASRQLSEVRFSTFDRPLGRAAILALRAMRRSG
jgi:predicted nucleic acid-binding protein